MGLSKKPYKGTRDFFPKDKRVHDYMFSIMKKTAHSFGYEHYDGPLLEEVELYLAKSGEELINDQIYSFIDRGNRKVAIRPEMTPTVARMVAQIHREVAKPIRWFSIPNLMRYERPQKGRLREHWQFNCDIFGAPEGRGDFEIISLIIELLENFGATSEHFEVLFNHRQFVDSVFHLISQDPEKVYKLYKLVDSSKKISQEKLIEEFNSIVEDSKSLSLFQNYLNITDLKALNTFIENHNLKEESTELLKLIEDLNQLNLHDYITFDPTIVRGLDYYTGTVFEVFDKNPENRRAICGGGSYANLLQIFNEPALPGVGFGLGDVTLKDFLDVHNLMPDLETPCFDVYITHQVQSGFERTIPLAKALRKAGISTSCHLEPLKIKKVFTNAQKLGANFVVLLGDDEVGNNTYSVKNLMTKEQRELSHEAAIDFILKERTKND